MIRELKKAIKAQLKAITPTVFGEQADNDADFPYVVFSFPSNMHQDGLFSGNMDADVWDRNDSSATVDNLADEIAQSLDKFQYLGESVMFTLHLLNILTVEPDDRTLRRTTVIFEIHFRRM